MTDTVKWTAEGEAQIPPEQRMMVSTSDWARVRRNTERMGDPPTEYAVNGSLALGGASLTLLGVAVGLEHATPSPSSSLLTGLWVAFALCAVFAGVLMLIGRRERARYRVGHRSVCEDMDEVAARGGRPGLGVPSPKRRLGIKHRLTRLWKGDPEPEAIGQVAVTGNTEPDDV